MVEWVVTPFSATEGISNPLAGEKEERDSGTTAIYKGGAGEGSTSFLYTIVQERGREIVGNY